MVIVNIEGYDNVGKSTLVDQLHNKYPDRIKPFRFPTLTTRQLTQDIEYDKTSISEIINHHYVFIEDFAEHQATLKKASIDEGKTVLVDRYFMSNIVYLSNDLKQYLHTTFEGDIKAGFPYYQKITHMISNFYHKNLLQPDLYIYLRVENPDDVYMDYTQNTYDYHFKQYFVTAPIVVIKALEPDTIDKIESLLNKKGYI